MRRLNGIMHSLNTQDSILIPAMLSQYSSLNTQISITGLILCGGKSTRMGSDKGLILKNGRSWVQVIADKVTALNIPYKISINQEQATNYYAIFDETTFIVDNASLPGPLRGILSAHQEYPETNWLILACDMIDMDPETLEGILKATKEVPGKEFYAYWNNTHYEPFAGIYTAAGLSQVYDAYCRKELTNYSLQYILNRYETHALSLRNNEVAFRNYNTL